MAKIVIIDDEMDSLIILRTFLTRSGHEVFPLLRAERALQEIELVNPDLVITDIVMPGVMGGTLYDAIRKQLGPSLPVIVSSGTRLRVKDKNDPLLAYCPKPVDFDELLAAINRLLERRRELFDQGTQNANEDLDLI